MCQRSWCRRRQRRRLGQLCQLDNHCDECAAYFSKTLTFSFPSDGTPALGTAPIAVFSGLISTTRTRATTHRLSSVISTSAQRHEKDRRPSMVRDLRHGHATPPPFAPHVPQSQRSPTTPQTPHTRFFSAQTHCSRTDGFTATTRFILGMWVVKLNPAYHEALKNDQHPGFTGLRCMHGGC